MMRSTQRRATRPTEPVFKPKFYGRFEEGVTVLSEATVTLGGVYVALTYSTDMNVVMISRRYYRITTLVTRHTNKGDDRLSSMSNRPYCPFLLLG